MLRLSLCQRNKSRGIKVWYARIYDTETKRVRYESLGTSRKAEAFELMTAKKAAGEFSAAGDAPTLGQAFKEYLAAIKARGASAQTMECAEYAFTALESLRPCKVTELDKKRLLDAFNARNGGLKASTYNTKAAYVKSAIKSCIEAHSLEIRNPAEILKARKRVNAERDFWTPEQVDRILDRAPDRARRLLWAFMAFAGLRIHEALKTTPADIRDGFLFVTGKGGKFAKVPVSSRLRSELDRAGWKWDFSGLNRTLYAVEKAAREAIPEGFPGKANNHRFRHSFASNLIRGGANPKAVQRLMRHSNIQTTLAIYSHVLQDDLSGELEKMFAER